MSSSKLHLRKRTKLIAACAALTIVGALSTAIYLRNEITSSSVFIAYSMSSSKLHLRKRTKLIAACAALTIVGALSTAIYLRNEITSSSVTHLSLESIAPLPKLKVGDLIFRMGVGADSFVIADVTNSKYSHMGMISAIEPEILVTHATTADDAGSNFEGVITIPLENFVSEASSLAIGRYQDLKDSSIEQVQNYLKSIEGQPFTITPDPRSIYCSSSEASSLAIGRYQDLKDSSIEQVQNYLKSIEGQPFTITPDPRSIYCSSMVIFALQDHVTMQVNKTFLNIPLNEGDYYVPQSFIEDPHLKIIYVFDDPQSL